MLFLGPVKCGVADSESPRKRALCRRCTPKRTVTSSAADTLGEKVAKQNTPPASTGFRALKSDSSRAAGKKRRLHLRHPASEPQHPTAAGPGRGVPSCRAALLHCINLLPPKPAHGEAERTYQKGGAPPKAASPAASTSPLNGSQRQKIHAGDLSQMCASSADPFLEFCRDLDTMLLLLSAERPP